MKPFFGQKNAKRKIRTVMMAQPKLQAAFFVSGDGVITQKSPPLKYDQRHKIYVRDGAKCRICSETVMFGGINSSPFQKIKSGQIDHIFPRSRGGNNDDENLRLLCLTCNSSKGAK